LIALLPPTSTPALPCPDKPNAIPNRPHRCLIARKRSLPPWTPYYLPCYPHCLTCEPLQ
jgi:hypothetical protein